MYRTLRQAGTLSVAAALVAFFTVSQPSRGEQFAIVHGPYLSQVTQESITVTWQTNRPGDTTVECAREGPAYQQQLPKVVKGRTSVAHHTVSIAGLLPGTRYRYKACSTPSAGGPPAAIEGSFQTAPPPGKPFTFVVYGDTRGDRSDHRAVVRQIIQLEPCFVLHTGDLVDDGRKPEDWNGFFGVANLMLKDYPFFPCLGNHDRNSAIYLDTFELPGNESWYAFEYGNALFVALNSTIPLLGPTEDMNENGQLDRCEDIGRDGLPNAREPGYDPVTNPDPNRDNYNEGRGPDNLAGTEDDTGKSRLELIELYTEGNRRWEFPHEPDFDGDEEFDLFDEDLDGDGQMGPTPQYAFLDSVLSTSSTTWKFVYFHHPPYSAGSHGSTYGLRKIWCPLFERFNVDVVFGGHDHSYERGQAKGVYYIVTGGGGAPLYHVGTGPWTAYSESALHCVKVSIDGKRLEGTMVRADGSVRDSFAIVKTKPED